jgi:fructose-bisphosphate aldolase class II
MSDICVARYEAFGTAGNASKLRAVSLEDMATRYERGELNATVN